MFQLHLSYELPSLCAAETKYGLGLTNADDMPAENVVAFGKVSPS